MSLHNIVALVNNACGPDCMQSANIMCITSHTSLQQSILVILLCILLVFAPRLLAFYGRQGTPYSQPADQMIIMPAHMLKGRIRYFIK